MDFRDADTGFRHNLVEGYGRSDGRLNGLNLNAIVAEGGNDTGAVCALFVLVDDGHGLVIVHFEQVERGELEVLKVFAGVVGTEFGKDGFGGVIFCKFYGLGVGDFYLIVCVGGVRIIRVIGVI